MVVEPDNIRNQEFESKFRGYDPEQVEAYLSRLANEVSDLQQKNQQLTQSLKESQERVSYFTDLKDALNQSIIVAQNAADRVKNNAQHEADTIKEGAENQAKRLLTEATERSNQILKDASERARHLTIETDDLKKQTRVFHQRFQVLLESQLAMLKTPEWQSLLGKADQDDEALGALLEDHPEQQEPTPPDQDNGTNQNHEASDDQTDEAQDDRDIASDEPLTNGEELDADAGFDSNGQRPSDTMGNSFDDSQSSSDVDQGTELDAKSDQPYADNTDESDSSDDGAPVFQHRHPTDEAPAPSAGQDPIDHTQAPENKGNENYDGVTIVFPDDNE